MEIKEVIERILLFKPAVGPVGWIKKKIKNLLSRFDMERMRAGSSYTQWLKQERKAASEKARAAKKANAAMERQTTVKSTEYDGLED